jgi:hypothetical protein
MLKSIPNGLAIFTFQLKWLINSLKSISIQLCKSNTKRIYDACVNSACGVALFTHASLFLFVFLSFTLSLLPSFSQKLINAIAILYYICKSRKLYFKVCRYDKIYVCQFKITFMRTTSNENKNFADFIANNYLKIKRKRSY